MALTSNTIPSKPKVDESKKDYEIRRDEKGLLYCYVFPKEKPKAEKTSKKK